MTSPKRKDALEKEILQLSFESSKSDIGTPKKEKFSSRRHFLQAGILLCAMGVQHLVHAQVDQRHTPKSASKGGKNGIVAVRIWPAPEYSRVTIESDNPLEVTHNLVADPPRLYVDIKHLLLGPELRNMLTRVQSHDPNISLIRIAQNSPDVVRMVIDLKQPVRPEVFTLKPIDPYRHRLVFDLYPLNAVDPMTQLIEDRLRQVTQNTNSTDDAQHISESQSTSLPPVSQEDLLEDWIAKNQAVETKKPDPDNAVREEPVSRPSRSQTDRIIIVALDPGHGGEDPGAIGQGGTREKDVVLAIAKRLRDLINNTKINGVAMQTYLTRERDFFVPLNLRVNKARRVDADIFISLHADAALNRRARGAGVYALSQRGASSTQARWLADKENRSDLIGGVNIRSKDRGVHAAILDMSTSAQVRDSLQLAQFIINELSKIVHMHKKAVEKANFAVLRSPDTPRVLVETAFLSNPDEERLLRDPKHQQKVAVAILAGVVKYFQKYPPQPRIRKLK